MHMHRVRLVALGGGIGLIASTMSAQRAPRTVTAAGSPTPVTSSTPAKPAAAKPATSTADIRAYLPFRKGLQVSYNGSTWGPARTIAVTKTECPVSTTSPCAAGTPALVVSFRFDTLPHPVELYKVLATIGE